MILVRPVIPIAVEEKNNFQQHSQLLMKKLVGSWEICTIDQLFQLLNNSEQVGMKQEKSNLIDFSESFQILIQAVSKKFDRHLKGMLPRCSIPLWPPCEVKVRQVHLMGFLKR
jgi:hypothetical protein